MNRYNQHTTATQMALAYEQRQREAEQEYTTHAQQRSTDVIAHYQTTSVSVTIPLLKTIITSVLIAIAAATVANMLGYAQWFKLGIVCLVTVLALDWVRRCESVSRRVEALEDVLQIDLNHNGVIGPVIEEPNYRSDPITLSATITDESKQYPSSSTAYFTLDEPARVLEFADALCRGQSNSMRRWSGSGALFSRKEYEHIRDQLMKRGWAAWSDEMHHDQGWTITEWAMMAVLAAEYRNCIVNQVDYPGRINGSTPLPQEDEVA